MYPKLFAPPLNGMTDTWKKNLSLSSPMVNLLPTMYVCNVSRSFMPSAWNYVMIQQIQYRMIFRLFSSPADFLIILGPRKTLKHHFVPFMHSFLQWDFSLQWLLLLWGAGSRARTQYLQHAGSVAAERKLWSVGSVVVVCGFSCFLAYIEHFCSI